MIEAVNELSAALGERLAASPSVPLDEPHPSASIVYSDEEYDTLAERLAAPHAPNQRLRRTMLDQPPRGPVNGDIRVAALAQSAPPFRSGHAQLDAWLARHGAVATRAGSARVYLAHRQRELVGYFALAAGSVEPAHAGTRTRRGMPRHPIPVVLLARLAVGEGAQGQGIGRQLVRQAALLTLRVARLVAARALVVDAIDEATPGFYSHVGFLQLSWRPGRAGSRSTGSGTDTSAAAATRWVCRPATSTAAGSARG